MRRYSFASKGNAFFQGVFIKKLYFRWSYKGGLPPTFSSPLKPAIHLKYCIAPHLRYKKKRQFRDILYKRVFVYKSSVHEMTVVDNNNNEDFLSFCKTNYEIGIPTVDGWTFHVTELYLNFTFNCVWHHGEEIEGRYDVKYHRRLPLILSIKPWVENQEVSESYHST